MQFLSFAASEWWNKLFSILIMSFSSQKQLKVLQFLDIDWSMKKILTHGDYLYLDTMAQNLVKNLPVI